MKKIANGIVKGRWILLGVFAVIIVLSIFGIPKVNIEYNIAAYLPKDTDTSKALEIMDDEFETFGTTTILVSDVSSEKATELYESIIKLDGVKSFSFDASSKEYYKDSNALFNITYVGDSNNQTAITAYNQTLDILRDANAKVAVPFVNDYATTLQKEISFILILAVVVIIIVLLLTTNSFFEVIVFLIVFGVAALINMGTNFFFGTVSFISSSVCVILQLALAIDYSIILSHHYSEERGNFPSDNKVAMSEALSKAIPEIFGSSLTTISGLLALACMSLRLGADLGFVLAKSIICSLLVVFFLMPSILLLCTKPIKKTSHKSFVPKINFWGKAMIKARYVVPAVFAVMFIAGAILSTNINFVYTDTAIDTAKPTQQMIAQEEITKIFGNQNQFVILVPKDKDYEAEKQVTDILKQFEAQDKVSTILAVTALNMDVGSRNLNLVDKLTYLDVTDILSEFAEVDSAIVKKVYRLYAIAHLDKFTEDYAIAPINLLQFVLNSQLILDEILDSYPELEEYINLVRDALNQLSGKNYTRIVFNINGREESTETFAIIEEMQDSIKSVCPQSIFAGNSMSAYDLDKSFSTDNLMITMLTIVFVYVVLLFTTRSWATPLLLIATIQGAIFINFAFPVMTGTNLFFFVYLIVNAIQMGATIDYAIVLTNRFDTAIRTMDKKDAVVDSINKSFPTIITSGSILTVAAFLVYFLVSDPLISTLGLALARGTIISVLSVMCVLPILLYFFGNLFQKTTFSYYSQKIKERKQRKQGNVESAIEEDVIEVADSNETDKLE